RVQRRQAVSEVALARPVRAVLQLDPGPRERPPVRIQDPPGNGAPRFQLHPDRLRLVTAKDDVTGQLLTGVQEPQPPRPGRVKADDRAGRRVERLHIDQRVAQADNGRPGQWFVIGSDHLQPARLAGDQFEIADDSGPGLLRGNYAVRVRAAQAKSLGRVTFRL